MTSRQSLLCWRLSGRGWVGVLVLLAAAGAPSAHAQAVVSYQQQLTAGWSRALSTSDAIRERRSLGVAGINVQPLGGGDTFTLRSQWELREQGAPFALTITEVNPEIRLDQTTSQFQSASVQRSASLVAAPTGRLSEVIPIVQLLPGNTLTVFTDP
jgi:hypothetical protein